MTTPEQVQLLPCPFCGVVVGEFADGGAVHQETGCFLDLVYVSPSARKA